MAFSYPAIRRASADGLRWLQARWPLRRAVSGEKVARGRALLMAAVLVTSLPWMGALLAYAMESNWPVSAAQAHWLQIVRAVCAVVLLTEWMVALAVGIVGLVIFLMRLARRPGGGSGTVSASEKRTSEPPR